MVICMDCSADTMTNRLLQRSQSSQRGEDTARTIAKRLEAYHRASIPVIAYYETKTQLRKVRLIYKWAARSFLLRERKERHAFLRDLGKLQAAAGVGTKQELLSSLVLSLSKVNRYKHKRAPTMVVHGFNPSTQEAISVNLASLVYKANSRLARVI